jgi:hypothetical protein
MVNEETKLPPVTELAISTLVCVVIGGIYMAGHIPEEVPTLIPTLLTIAGAAILAVNIVMLARVRQFAWRIFRQVFLWSLVGYGVISGLILWVFIRDDIPSDVMTLLTASLAIFALNIPLLFGFSVARYQPVDEA